MRFSDGMAFESECDWSDESPANKFKRKFTESFVTFFINLTIFIKNIRKFLFHQSILKSNFAAFSIYLFFYCLLKIPNFCELSTKIF